MSCFIALFIKIFSNQMSNIFFGVNGPLEILWKCIIFQLLKNIAFMSSMFLIQGHRFVLCCFISLYRLSFFYLCLSGNTEKIPMRRWFHYHIQTWQCTVELRVTRPFSRKIKDMLFISLILDFGLTVWKIFWFNLMKSCLATVLI